MYLSVEERNPNEHRHKLAPVTDGPFKVVNPDAHALTIERADRSIETVHAHAFPTHRTLP